MLHAFQLYADECRLIFTDQKYNLVQDAELDAGTIGSCCSGPGLDKKPGYTNKLEIQGSMNRVAKLFSI